MSGAPSGSLSRSWRASNAWDPGVGSPWPRRSSDVITPRHSSRQVNRPCCSTANGQSLCLRVGTQLSAYRTSETTIRSDSEDATSSIFLIEGPHVTCHRECAERSHDLLAIDTSQGRRNCLGVPAVLLQVTACL